MGSYKLFISISILIVLMVLSSGLFIVPQHQLGIVLRLGQIEKNSQGEPNIRKPGLNFKIPLITTAKLFDIRLQSLNIESSRYFTSEKKNLLVDYFVKWRIKDLVLFYTRTEGKIDQAENLLRQKVNAGMRDEFGKRTIQEVVSGERRDIMAILRDEAKESVKGLGLDVIDVRIKRIDLPVEVSNAVYARMRAERERIANEHRAEGQAKSEAIKAQADADITVINATAINESKKIRGAGDAKAAKIYAEAYQKDPEFFSFYRSMNSYRSVFKNKNDLILLRPDSQFFNYFKNAKSK